MNSKNDLAYEPDIVLDIITAVFIKIVIYEKRLLNCDRESHNNPSTENKIQ